MKSGWSFWGKIAAVLFLFTQTVSAVLTFDNKFRSPRNKERPMRRSTSLIILHTTEAASSSALQKLSALGECNYCIAENGKVYRIIDRQREAFHAGRSMWNGRANVDSFSVGIEMCGYHNRPLSRAQYRALADLIGELKAIYKIPDHCVISHSQVAYGTPNKWFKRSHRGRKRCGMMFALPSVRRLLNLRTRPGSDPDVKAGRLIVGDPYLARVLYGGGWKKAPPVITAAKPERAKTPRKNKAGSAEKGKTRVIPAAPAAVPSPMEVAAAAVAAVAPQESNVITKGHGAWDIARGAFNDESTVYTFPDGSKKRGNQIINFKSIPVGTRVEVKVTDENLPDTYQTIGVNGNAQDIAGEEALQFTTIYVYPDGHYFRGSQLSADSVLKLPYNTKVLMGYAIAGPVTSRRPPISLCGARWRAKDTFYLIYNVLVSGEKVDDNKIPSGTMVFYKN